MTTPRIHNARLVKWGVQTPVQELRKPDGTRVTLVSCVHLGEPEYYEALADIVHKLEANGATVYMEGTRTNIDRTDATVTELDNALTIQYERLPTLFELPWVYQGSTKSAIFPYPPTWKTADVPADSLALLMGPENAAMVGPLAAKYEGWKTLKARGKYSPPFQMARRRYWKSFALHNGNGVKRRHRALVTVVYGIARMFGKPHPKPEWAKRIAYDYRELTAALAALKDGGDVVLLWHPNHMPAIGDVLIRNGFVPEEPSQWLQATHPVPKQVPAEEWRD